MSYLSASENVGYSGIPQTISDATCASQYKMAVEGVPAVCTEMNSFINENSGDENSYSNDNYFHSKFKIDPNELYTFHDSDIIAGEITVSHTEDNFIFNDNIDTKPVKMCFESPRSDIDVTDSTNKVCIKEEIKPNVVQNGHLKTANKTTSQKDVKTSNTKVQKVVKSLSQLIKDPLRTKLSNVVKSSINTKGQANVANTAANLPTSTKTSINSVSSNPTPVIPNVKTGSETFLDVFKREQGLVEEAAAVIKTEPDLPPPVKVPGPPPIKKIPSGKPASAKRRGRGPTVHEALQRIPRRAVPVASRPWHAPGHELFDCGPLGDPGRRPFTMVDSSSSEDDEHWPNFGEHMGCVEETMAESRGARLALRRAALRRQVAQASAAMRLRDRRAPLPAAAIKKQLSSPGARLPATTVNQLLALRGMPSLLTSQERRVLRQSGWSGGESLPPSPCSLPGCPAPALPLCSHCLPHARRSTGQQLYAACAALFADGDRCAAPVLPLQGPTPLCAQHQRKRDNYDKLSREVKPKKPLVRRRWPPPPRRRRRPPLKKINSANQSLSELNVCSNSSAYDSSEEAALGALSDSEFIASAAHELEVEQVPPDDILDSAVLGQIPDEAFTEFFNQAEGGATFAESSELARALEAVLDERALDSLADSLQPGTKMQVSSVGVEMSSGVSS